MKTISLYVPFNALLPDWAKFIAMDLSGEWYAYSHKPKRYGFAWTTPQIKGQSERVRSLPQHSACKWASSLQSV